MRWCFNYSWTEQPKQANRKQDYTQPKNNWGVVQVSLWSRHVPAFVGRTRCSLAHARADGRETDCEAGANGGERWDPHSTVLAKTNVASYSEGTHDAEMSQHQQSLVVAICGPTFSISFPTFLNPSSLQIPLQLALPEPVSSREHGTPASACAA